MYNKMLWPWWLRLSHWLVAIGINTLWVLAYFYYETDVIHRYLGYAVLNIVMARVLMACITQVASAKLTWPSCNAVMLHIKHLKQLQPPKSQGHNPLGQIAIYVMWLLIALLGFTGWLSQTDVFWGEDLILNLHQWLNQILMFLVLLHITAVLIVGRLSKQN